MRADHEEETVPPGADAVPPAPQPVQEMWAFLTNPLLLAFVALFAAWVASKLVVAQVTDMGLDGPEPKDGEHRFRWSALFGALSFWAVLTLGLLGIAAASDLTVVAKFLQTGFDVLLRAAIAGAILAGAGSFARIVGAERGDAADPASLARARDERHTILLVGGVLAVLAVTGLGLGTWIFLAVIGAPLLTLLKSERARAKAAAALGDLAAGLKLRDQVRARAEVHGSGRTLTLTGQVGLVQTWVREGRQRKLIGNAELLGVVTGEPSPVTPAAPADEEAPEATDEDTSDVADEDAADDDA